MKWFTEKLFSPQNTRIACRFSSLERRRMGVVSLALKFLVGNIEVLSPVQVLVKWVTRFIDIVDGSIIHQMLIV